MSACTPVSSNLPLKFAFSSPSEIAFFNKAKLSAVILSPITSLAFVIFNTPFIDESAKVLVTLNASSVSVFVKPNTSEVVAKVPLTVIPVLSALLVKLSFTVKEAFSPITTEPFEASNEPTLASVLPAKVKSLTVALSVTLNEPSVTVTLPAF